MEVFGPETFSRLQRSIREETNSPSLKNALSVIRLSYFDSDVFYKFRQVYYIILLLLYLFLVYFSYFKYIEL